MIWGAISHRGLGPLVLKRRVREGDYISILADHLPPMVQTVFTDKLTVFQDDNVPIPTSGTARDFYEHDDETELLVWLPQSPELNVIEPLWGILENMLHYRCPLQGHFLN